ncbi:Uma2 family endonuclease [Anabaenopsis tanganyikae CS-531]|uniref:Uma2 family endonuclease n=2 Tax=Anabaenopsis TaxID=110103 RepID=A0ABT6KGV6_9CYAN|nr:MULTISPECIES: Uma2 family endonuclease [Anabaenopsis]MDB9540273.1 Uma2 family endonuclease [Anabaenopsis arnoldii]MDH6092672.1 Uma2 family endonuclease [Anabaenopsis arnoldii]MDH6107011.1 Uma2 family endonuclease [Anabaenopsis tanganyikae CS-531]
MGKSALKLITVDEFIAEYGDQENYELIDGELIEVEPTGPHEQVSSLIGRKLNVEIDHQDLPYFIPHRCLIKLLGTNTAFRPDVIVLDQTQLINEPLWQQEPVITSGKSIKLIAEVVSTNWQNDYARKVEDYALLGVSEYWIVDYLGIGGRDYIGKIKQPTVTICTLLEDEYQKRLFQNNDQLVSSIFPNLQLTAKQVFTAGVSPYNQDLRKTQQK